MVAAGLFGGGVPGRPTAAPTRGGGRGRLGGRADRAAPTATRSVLDGFDKSGGATIGARQVGLIDGLKLFGDRIENGLDLCFGQSGFLLVALG